MPRGMLLPRRLHLLPTLAALLLTGSTLIAADPRIIVLVDGSGATAPDIQVRDRLRLVVDHLLPKERQIWHFDRDIRRIPSLSEVGFESRWSDYHLAFSQVAGLAQESSRSTVALLLGGGQISIQGPTEATPGPASTQDALNIAAQARTTGDFATLVAGNALRWLVISPALPSDSPAPGIEPGLWDWIHRIRPDTRFLSARHLLLSEVLPALHGAGVPLPGQILGGTVRVLSPGAPAATFDLKEGSPSVDLYLNALGEDPDFAVALTANGSPLKGEQIQEVDGLGVARHLVLTGLDAGATISMGMSGFSQGYEVVALAHPRILHRMSIQADSDDGRFYTGDRLPIGHLFTRAPGATPVAASTSRDLLAQAKLLLNGQELPSLAQLDLPGEPGSAALALAAGGTQAPWVSSEPLQITWGVIQPIELSGGFSRNRTIEDGRVDLRFTVSGGRRRLVDLPLTLVCEDGRRQTLTLAAVPGTRDYQIRNHSFSVGERGHWRILEEQRLGESSTRVIPGSGLSLTIDVSRDWLPTILLAGLAVVGGGGLSLWWLMSRPRFTHQILDADGTCRELANLPGMRRGSSWGLSAFVRTVMFNLDPQGAVQLALVVPAARLHINGRPVAVGTPVKLRSGSDIEVVLPNHQRIHARFWTSIQDREAWSPDRAQIDLGRDLAGEHVILEA